MTDLNVWRETGPRKLIAYLSSATGEQHDAAVYDTRYEFNPNNPNAVRFVASVAMTKASEGVENFIVEMPQDGSVAPYDEIPNDERMRQSYLNRKSREDATSKIYVPDADQYCECVLDAIKLRDIPVEDMTTKELREHKRKVWQEKSHITTFDLLGTLLVIALFVGSVAIIVLKIRHSG